MVGGLAGLRACDGTDAVSDFRPASRVDGAAGAVVGVEGCWVACAASGGRGAAAPAPEAEAGLGRPGGARCLGAAAARAAAVGQAGDSGDAAGMAPAAGSLAVDLPRHGGRPPAGPRV